MVTEDERLPNNFTIRISQQAGTTTTRLYNKTGVKNDPTRVDTLFLPGNDGEPAIITVPYCEFFNTWNKDDFNVSIDIESRGTVKANDKSIRIDKFIFIPVSDPE